MDSCRDNCRRPSRRAGVVVGSSSVLRIVDSPSPTAFSLSHVARMISAWHGMACWWPQSVACPSVPLLLCSLAHGLLAYDRSMARTCCRIEAASHSVLLPIFFIIPRLNARQLSIRDHMSDNGLKFVAE